LAGKFVDLKPAQPPGQAPPPAVRR